VSRVPLSDESVALDDDVVEDEGSPGKEEQFKELDFDLDPKTDYEPPLFDEFEDDEDFDKWEQAGGWDDADDDLYLPEN